jgi:hypothetical protein
LEQGSLKIGVLKEGDHGEAQACSTHAMGRPPDRMVHLIGRGGSNPHPHPPSFKTPMNDL